MNTFSPECSSKDVRNLKVCISVVFILLAACIGNGCKHVGGHTTKSVVEHRFKVFQALLALSTARDANEQELAANQLAIVLKNDRPTGLVGITVAVLPLNSSKMPIEWRQLDEISFVVVFDPVAEGSARYFRSFEIPMYSGRTTMILRELHRIGTYSPKK